MQTKFERVETQEVAVTSQQIGASELKVLYALRDIGNDVDQFSRRMRDKVDTALDAVAELNELTIRLQREVGKLQTELARERW